MKNGSETMPSRGVPLALTLTAYYSLSAFLIVLLATGYLYWAMVRNLDLEDDRLLADRVRLLNALLLRDPPDLAALYQEVDEVWQGGQRTQVFIRILNVQGRTICVSKNMEDILPAVLFPTASINFGAGHDVYSKHGRLHRAMSVALSKANGLPPEWIIQVGMDRGEEEEMLSDYRENLSVVLLISFVVCALAGYQITRRGIRPLHLITRVVSQTQPTRLSQRIDTRGLPSELQKLVDTFNEMLQRLEVAFSRLSRFTADIAHELRTPVNNMRGELDVVLAKPRSPIEYEEAIGSSLEELARLSRTIESLLFLARAENPQTQVDRECLTLREEIATICEFFSATADDAGVELKSDVESNLKVDLNRALFQQAIGNLVANAISHTPPGGQITVWANQSGTGVAIEVADSGCGIAPEHLPHLLDRFYRVDDAGNDQRQGMGLGLSIVKSIVELHGGGIEIASEQNVGTRVRLIFPTELGK